MCVALGKEDTMTIRYCFTLLLIAGLAGSVTAGEITGKVKLKGTPKPEIPIDLDPTCKKLHAKPITTRHYIVGAENGLGNVFVYIKEGAKKAPPPSKPFVLDQQSCQYQPYVFGVVAGQKIIVKNSDPLLHNVHATPKLNKEFNFAQPVKGQENAVTFDKPEVLVRIKCDVHPWMFSYAGVVEHPYFAVTDKDGSFTIPNVPPGKYTLEAFHLKAGAKTQEITLAEGDKKALEFELDAPAK
jgi:plastocyanin